MRSPLLCIALCVIRCTRWLSLYGIVEWFAWERHKKQTCFWFTDFYVVFWLCLIMAGLFGRWATWFVFLCAYGLFELLRDVGQMLFVNFKEDAQGHYLRVRNVERGILLVLLNIGQVILSFSAFYLFWGAQFKEKIDDPLTALYHSTMATFFNGVVTPESWKAQVLVVAHLLYVFIFIAVRAPIIFQAVRVKQTW